MGVWQPHHGGQYNHHAISLQPNCTMLGYFTLYVAVERPRSNDITRLKRRKAFQAFHRCYNPFTMHQMVAIEPLCL